MIGLNMVLSSIVTIVVIVAIIMFKDNKKVLVIDWKRGLKIYLEDQEDDADGR